LDPRLTLPVWVLMAACTTGTSYQQMAPEDDFVAAPAPEATWRRLTQDQIKYTLHDVFGDGLALPNLSEPDPIQGGLQSVGTASSTYSARGVESLEAASFRIAAQVVSDPALAAQHLPCDPAEASCREERIRTWGVSLWRRPLTDDEVADTLALIDTAYTALGDYPQALEMGLARLLQSPHFLYRTEMGSPDDPTQLTDLELASRLAFFLWDAAPDADLIQAALDGELSTREGLFERANRMLDDPRARRGLRAYFLDAFHLHELHGLRKDPTVFEHFNDRLELDAEEETLRLLEYITLDAELDFREVLTTRETFLSPYLASLYGVPAPAAEGFASTVLDPALGRAGLLGHASFLASHAHTTSSSATLRGEAVRTTLLCHPIPAPPVDVDTSIPEPSGETPTLRDRVAEHLENPSCAGCHSLMDPIGLALENFDGIGRYRETDNGYPIDASGEVDQVPFTNAVELGQVLAANEDFSSCMVQTLARYATGTSVARDDHPWVDVLAERFPTTHKHRWRPLLLELVTSPLFRRVSPVQEVE